MPYGIVHGKYKKDKTCYGVKNKSTGHKFSKCTTKSKARRQENLLRAVEHGWHPTGKKARK